MLTPPMRRVILFSTVRFVAVLASMLLAIQADSHTSVHELSVFYTVFVLLQFWNLFNARVSASDHPAFRGVRANPSFLVIAGAIPAGQILIIQVGGEVFRTQPLTLVEWAAVIGGTSLVLWFGELSRAAGNRSRGWQTLSRAPG